MNCIIVDDEEASRVILNQLCSVSEDLDLIDEFSNALPPLRPRLCVNERSLIFP